MKKIMIIHGPNMNLLGIREPEIYGKRTFSDLCGYIKEHCGKYNFSADFFQSNHEGAIIDAIQGLLGRYDGLIINPAAYTHTSIAIPDAIRAVAVPAVEVHLSDISSREEYRRISYTASACIGSVSGKGFSGYDTALQILSDYFVKISWKQKTAPQI